MLVGISGTPQSGRQTVRRILSDDGFTVLSLKSARGSAAAAETFQTIAGLVDFVTQNWLKDYVLIIDDLKLLRALSKRPFFVHLSLDAPLWIRWRRETSKTHSSLQIEEFVKRCDSYVYENHGAEIIAGADITLINDYHSTDQLAGAVTVLDLRESTRIRPSWDAYFMRLALLASRRSNCMKRRVGCVLVRGKRVIATGYNGTPMGLKNCNEGGCARCNKGVGSGGALSTCLCLHAEENALLESGRDRVGQGSILYCTTCPCLTCSIKIIQSGISEVIYSESYSMDAKSAAVFEEAGVLLRQYHDVPNGLVQRHDLLQQMEDVHISKACP